MDLNTTFLDLRKYNTLAINVTAPSMSLVLKLEPSETMTLQLYLGLQYYPNDTHYKAKVQLPQPGKLAGDLKSGPEDKQMCMYEYSVL